MLEALKVKETKINFTGKQKYPLLQSSSRAKASRVAKTLEDVLEDEVAKWQ